MRKHNYLVGYKGEGQCVYGDEKQGYGFTTPMTLSQAKRLSKKVFGQIGRKKFKFVIYKLVEVQEEK